MRRLYIPIAVVIAVACYSFIFTHLRPQIPAHDSGYSNNDFSCFYRAGKMALSGQGRNIYDIEAEKAFDVSLQAEVVKPGQNFLSMAFLFPPFTLLLYAPIAALPYHRAELLCNVLNVAALIACPLVLWAKGLLRDRQAALWIAATPFFFPVALALLRGQPVPLIFLFLTLTFIAFREQHDVTAGSLLALASIKPQIILPLFLAILIGRKWKAVLGFISTGAFTVLATVPIAGWRGTEKFLHAIAGNFLEYPWLTPDVRAMMYDLLHSRLSYGHLKTATLAVSLLLGLACALYLAKRQPTAAAGFSMAITVGLVASAHTGVHDLPLVLLAAMLAWQVRERLIRTVVSTLVALLFFLPFLVPFRPEVAVVVTFCLLTLLAVAFAVAANTSFLFLHRRRFPWPTSCTPVAP